MTLLFDGTVYRFTPEELHELVFQAAGAATAPLLEENPGYIFPSELVAEGVKAVLEEKGVEIIEGYK